MQVQATHLAGCFQIVRLWSLSVRMSLYWRNANRYLRYHEIVNELTLGGDGELPGQGVRVSAFVKGKVTAR